MNYLSRAFRFLASFIPFAGLYPEASLRPQGISIYMRVKDERDWIEASILSVKDLADEIIIADNGSTDGTYEILEQLARSEKGLIRLWRRPELKLNELSNFALDQTRYHWVFRLDGDMIARTNGMHPVSELRSRILSLNPKRYYLIYLRHINLSGDLGHQDPEETVHHEEYVHTWSAAARFIHPGRFEAVKFPLYYQPLFWYDPYIFHVNIKPARRMLLRYFWEDWMELKDYAHYPTLEDYVRAHIEKEFATSSIEEAQQKCLSKVLQNHVLFNADHFGPYPEHLRPLLDQPKYRILYKNNRIVGRQE